jgi:FecR protein
MNPEQRLQYLIDRHLDEALTVEEAVELNKWLARDESARERFWQTARIHARLRQWGEQQIGRVEVTGASPSPRRRWRRLLVALTALLFVGVGAILWGIDWHTEPRIVARFGAMENARWVGAENCREGDAIRAAQRVEIASGQVRIDFERGAFVTLIGPAVFDVESEKGAFLALGRLTARADTPESRGFTIRTRTARVVDMGTEFSAESAANGQSRFGVLSGAVEVTASEQRHLLHSGDILLVEPGAARVSVRIERGDETPAFRFPTIEPPSDQDYADARQGHAKIRVARGILPLPPKVHPNAASGPIEALVDGHGQSSTDAPRESVYFDNASDGMILLDLGSAVSVEKINTYSWHKNQLFADNRLRAQQNYWLYGFAGASAPSVDGPLEAAGWVSIAHVNTDEFFGVVTRLDRPAQQACSITSATGTLGRYRYLLWDVKPSRFPDFPRLNHTFYGEFDVYAQP